MSLILMKIVVIWSKVSVRRSSNYKLQKPVFLLPESGRVSAAAALRPAGAFLHLQLLSFFITHSSFIIIINCTFL